MTRSRVLESAADAVAFGRFLQGQKYPLTVAWTPGAKRTNPQNRTAHMWYKEIADQRGDTTPEEVKAECKLHFGVPILRRENPLWCAEYDATLKPLPYETKLRIMRLSDWAVTSKMTKPQACEYMDTLRREFAEQGITLTDPEMQKYGEPDA